MPLRISPPGTGPHNGKPTRGYLFFADNLRKTEKNVEIQKKANLKLFQIIEPTLLSVLLLDLATTQAHDMGEYTEPFEKIWAVRRGTAHIGGKNL